MFTLLVLNIVDHCIFDQISEIYGGGGGARVTCPFGSGYRPEKKYTRPTTSLPFISCRYQCIIRYGASRQPGTPEQGG